MSNVDMSIDLRDVRFQLLEATRHQWGVFVQYVGRLDDLVASGAVTERRAALIRAPRGRGKRFVDDHRPLT